MGLSKVEKLNINCIECGVKLTTKNWHRSIQKQGWRLCKQCYNKRTVKAAQKLRKVNPLKYKAYDLRHVYKGDIETSDLEIMWESQKGKCNICKSKLNINSFHVDHIYPISLGGKTEIENLQFLCEMCNRGKFNWSDEEYIAHCKKVAINN